MRTVAKDVLNRPRGVVEDLGALVEHLALGHACARAALCSEAADGRIDLLRAVGQLLVPRHRRVHHAEPLEGLVGRGEVGVLKVCAAALFLDDQPLVPRVACKG